MPAKRPARTCRKPSCLCNRPLGADLLNTHCFSVVACSHNCRRPVFYFHEQCAEFYVQSLKTCGWCKAKLVSLRSPSTTNLRDTLHENTQRFSWRRRVRRKRVKKKKRRCSEHRR